MTGRFFTLIIVALTISSCAGLTYVTVPQSNINIIDKDIETGQKLTYTLQKTYILGIGGLSRRARNTNVVDELFKQANLRKNESLAYITKSKNVNSYLGILTIVKHTATGYIVRAVERGSHIEVDTTVSYRNEAAEKVTYNDQAAVVKKESEREKAEKAEQNKQELKNRNKEIEETVNREYKRLEQCKTIAEVYAFRTSIERMVFNHTLSENDAKPIYEAADHKIRTLLK